MRFLKSRLFSISMAMAGITLSLLVGSCTKNEKELPAPTIYLNMPEGGYELEVGDSLLLDPKITYDYDANHRWYLNGQILPETEVQLMHRSINMGQDVYGFAVETPAGYDSVSIPVNTIILADFMHFDLPAGFNVGLNLPVESPWFLEDGIRFPVDAGSETQWSGYALSNKYSQVSTSTDVYSVWAPKEIKNNFLIYHQPTEPQNSALRFADGEDHLLGSISVCNSTLTYLIIKYGAEGIKRFGGESNDDPDWFKLTFEGYDKTGNSTGLVEFLLADYRFPNNKENYIVNKWSVVDLGALGAVNRVTLKLTSSVTNELGEMLTPAMVCIDNLKVLN